MSAKHRADDLFSLLVRARAGRCEVCGTPGYPNQIGPPVVGLDCAHIVPRRYGATRIDPVNAVALCREDHLWYTEHPIAWQNWAVEYLGHAVWERLVERARDPLTRVDWDDECTRMRAELKRRVAVA